MDVVELTDKIKKSNLDKDSKEVLLKLIEPQVV